MKVRSSERDMNLRWHDGAVPGGFSMTRTKVHRRTILAALAAAVLLPAGALAQSPAATPAEVLQTKTGPVKVERLATLVEPWGMAYLPDGRLLVGLVRTGAGHRPGHRPERRGR